eukprot:GFYU01009553.1.p1 GENE.GFYU01009553.1~~GFYU01009553.1.p1  ORF type:complete len:621 (-),score=97.94 GFYU01009553.1:23-1885(-)
MMFDAYTCEHYLHIRRTHSKEALQQLILNEVVPSIRESQELTNAFIHICSENDVADSLEESWTGGRRRSSSLNTSAAHNFEEHPLCGIPFVVKDNIATGLPGVACTAGAAGLRDMYPQHASACVAKILELGGVFTGTTNLHELALEVMGSNHTFGDIRNPVDPQRTSGGSSSGTAAAIASSAIPVGLGTDTGGSCRIPAALTGIVGYRPTTGLYPEEGVVGLSWTCDTVGVMGKTVDDIATIHAAITSAAAENFHQVLKTTGGLGSVQPGRHTLALPEDMLWDEIDVEVYHVMRRTLYKLCAHKDTAEGTIENATTNETDDDDNDDDDDEEEDDDPVVDRDVFTLVSHNMGKSTTSDSAVNTSLAGTADGNNVCEDDDDDDASEKAEDVVSESYSRSKSSDLDLDQLQGLQRNMVPVVQYELKRHMAATLWELQGPSIQQVRAAASEGARTRWLTHAHTPANTYQRGLRSREQLIAALTNYFDVHQVDAILYPTCVAPACKLNAPSVTYDCVKPASGGVHCPHAPLFPDLMGLGAQGNASVSPMAADGDYILEEITRIPFALYTKNTAIAAFAGFPCISIPAGRTASGLPVGLEICGRPGSDNELMKLARKIERRLAEKQ